MLVPSASEAQHRLDEVALSDFIVDFGILGTTIALSAHKDAKDE